MSPIPSTGRLLLLGLLVVLVSLPTVTRAQVEDRREGELAEAIYGLSLSSRVLTQARLGHLPEGIDASFLPEGAEIVGGFVLEDPWEGGDPIPVGVARTQAEFSQALDIFFDSLPEGWGAMTMGGNGWVDVCGPDPFSDVAFVEREAGGTYMVWSEVAPARPCDPARGTMIEAPSASTSEDLERPDEDRENVIGDGEIIDEPDVIAEPSEPRKPISSPKIPSLILESDSIISLRPIVEAFGRVRGGEHTGSATREVFTESTVEEIAAQARVAFEADGWTLLGAHEVEGVAVSVWSRTDDRGRRIVATVTVRPAYRSAVATVTATR